MSNSKSMVRYEHLPIPPRHWMISEDAIAMRAKQLMGQSPHRTAQECRASAEAEYRAAGCASTGPTRSPTVR